MNSYMRDIIVNEICPPGECAKSLGNLTYFLVKLGCWRYPDWIIYDRDKRWEWREKL